jgi:hypothetical protein
MKGSGRSIRSAGCRAESRPELEKPDSVDQKSGEVLKFLADHTALFCRQGSVQASWRSHHGKRLGPFFRLAYRHAGTQSAIYLGADAALAEEVRRVLEEMQAPLRERRERDRQLALMRAALKKHKNDLRQALKRLGLVLKGSQIRGWRNLRSRHRGSPEERQSGGGP